jgi:hypothetical protein
MRPLREKRRGGLKAACALALGAAVAASASPQETFERAVRPVLAARCALCHAADEPEAGLDLLAFATEAKARERPEVWALVRDRLAWGEMPPAGAPQPEEAEIDGLFAWIDGLLGPAAVADGPPDPGPTPLRRLNNREYAHTVRDLFGVEFDAPAVFPRDAVGHGFDNGAEAAALPDALFEKYLDAAEAVAARAIAVDDTLLPWTRRIGVDELGTEKTRGDAAALYSNGAVGARVTVPRDGRYRISASAWAQQAGDEQARMRLAAGGRALATVDVEAGPDAPEAYALEAELAGGALELSAAFVNDYYRPEHPDEAKRDRNLYVRWIEITGPLDPPAPTAFQGELFARFGAELGPRRLERTFAYLAERVWRRPPEPAEVDRLVRAARAPGSPGDDEGPDATHAARVRLGLELMLASPRFLFRVEPEPADAEPGEIRPVEGYALATRLAYFLWSSTPDGELFARAADGTLGADDVLAAEVERMLAHPRARALAEGFAAQWLEIQALDTLEFDRARYPEADRALRESMRAETLALFLENLRAKRDARELLTADHTFVDARLAAHYGLDFAAGAPADELGAGLRRVSLDGTPRRGLLGHASVLAATSNPTRTSPVKRGKWVLQALLGQPPPPPPPGADRFDERPETIAAASMRARLAAHRADPACAVCHTRMDALGFGLEHWGPTGRWRDSADGFPIDASAELPNGARFDGADELADVLAGDPAFVRALVEKLTVYALGRGLVRADRPTIRAVLAGLDAERPTLSAMVRGIVLSPAFRTRRVGAGG